MEKIRTKNKVSINTNNNIKSITVKCPYCNSESIYKRGMKCNRQKYSCKKCKKYFIEGGDYRVKRPPEQRELCLRLYANNMPMRRIQRMIEETFDTKISFNLIDKWIKSSVKRLKEDIMIKEKEEKESNKENNKEEKESNKENNKEEKESNKENNKEEKESNKERKDNINDNKNTINILEVDELYTHYYDSKKN